MKGLRKDQNGQIVLITLLVLAIATTVALSLISRSTNDASISREVEESSRAFNAAEAGIEDALQTAIGTNTPVTLSGGASYKVDVRTLGGQAGVYQLPKKSLQGTTETIWLVNHDTATKSIIEAPTYTSNSISFCWTKKSDSEIPAVVATLLYNKGGVYQTAKAVFDPGSAGRSPSNNFLGTVIATGCADGASNYKATMTFSTLNSSSPINSAVDTLIALRLRPVYYDTQFFIDSGAIEIPDQGYIIESTGSTVGGTNRKIIVYQQYRSPSTIFDAGLYSEGVLTK